ncbi:MAG TPA: hypothetical protein VFF95_07560 [Candidatus Binatus sp.]|nr:hypothetical protein [Candidatus Binatus sp.]
MFPNSGLRKTGLLFLDLTYTSKVEETSGAFVSNYSFLVRPVDMKPGRITPVQWQEHMGILNPEKQTMEDALKTFAGPEGTMMFAVPERRSDGSLNLLVIANDKRRFVFDPASRAVTFETVMATGRRKLVTAELPVNPSAVHIIGPIWDAKGQAELTIDGKMFP